MHKYCWVFLGLLMIFGCKQRAVEPDKQVPSQEDLIRINQYLLREDQEKIEQMAKRKSWDMTKTPSGLWYEVIERGSDKQGQKGDELAFTYTVSLMNGKEIFSSDSLGIKRFNLDQSTVEAGWNELAKLLHEGDSARMILPPHLAFGLAGDGQKVPPRSTLIYHVRLIELDSRID